MLAAATCRTMKGWEESQASIVSLQVTWTDLLLLANLTFELFPVIMRWPSRQPVSMIAAAVLLMLLA